MIYSIHAISAIYTCFIHTRRAYMVYVAHTSYVHYAHNTSMLISYSYTSHSSTTVPSRPVPAAMASTLRYYSSDIHKVI